MQDNGFGIDTVAMTIGVGVSDHAKWQPKWTIEKYDKDMKLYEIEEIDGNKLLKSGIEEFMKVACGIGGTAFNSNNAHIGVGDGTAPVDDAQAGLIGTNKSYAPMDATYPQVSGNVMTFRATFASENGNHDWREFAVTNGGSSSSKHLNRKVETQDRKKFSPDTWVVQLQITIS